MYMMNKCLTWVEQRFPLMRTWKSHASEYYLPKNLNFYYVFGVLALVVLVNQLVTGLWLTMFYTPSADRAFDSIEYIMRDVNYGWLLRYMHSTGASAFFIVIYLHLFRALLYGSYQKPRELVWLLGMLLFVLLLMEAFMGYLLPWGQMSYWGAQVITSLFSAIPYVGESLVTWIRGDFQVGNATLQRFFALHAVGVPLLMVFLVFLHLVALHTVGSNNPEGIDIKRHTDRQGKPLDGIAFHPYYTTKDLTAVVVFLILFAGIVFFAPEMGGYFLEYENFMPANNLVTPDHIAPVWYMTPFYAMLRAVPNKLAGVITMGCAIGILFILPWLDASPVRSMRYKGWISKLALTAVVISFCTLGYLGMQMLTPGRLFLARVCTAGYFAYFIMMPWYSQAQRCRRVPERIGEAR